MGVNEDSIKEKEKERAEQLDHFALASVKQNQTRAHVLPSICQLESESNPQGVDKTFVKDDWCQWNSLLKRQGFTVTSQLKPPSFCNKAALEKEVWETFWNVGTYLVGPTHQVTSKREEFAMLNLGSFILYCGHGLSPESALLLAESRTCSDFHNSPSRTGLQSRPKNRTVAGGELCLHNSGYVDLFAMMEPIFCQFEERPRVPYKSRTCLLLFDSCHSGLLAEENSLEKIRQLAENSSVRVIIQASCGPNEGALGGIFTHVFEAVQNKRFRSLLNKKSSEETFMQSPCVGQVGGQQKIDSDYPEVQVGEKLVYLINGGVAFQRAYELLEDCLLAPLPVPTIDFRKKEKKKIKKKGKKEKADEKLLEWKGWRSLVPPSEEQLLSLFLNCLGNWQVADFKGYTDTHGRPTVTGMFLFVPRKADKIEEEELSPEPSFFSETSQQSLITASSSSSSSSSSPPSPNCPSSSSSSSSSSSDFKEDVCVINAFRVDRYGVCVHFHFNVELNNLEESGFCLPDFNAREPPTRAVWHRRLDLYPNKPLFYAVLPRNFPENNDDDDNNNNNNNNNSWSPTQQLLDMPSSYSKEKQHLRISREVKSNLILEEVYAKCYEWYAQHSWKKEDWNSLSKDGYLSKYEMFREEDVSLKTLRENRAFKPDNGKEPEKEKE